MTSRHATPTTPCGLLGALLLVGLSIISFSGPPNALALADCPASNYTFYSSGGFFCTPTGSSSASHFTHGCSNADGSGEFTWDIPSGRIDASADGLDFGAEANVYDD